MDTQESRRTANARTLRRMLLVTVAMFGFGFALVPLYDVFCEITGLNGKTGRIDAQAAGQVQVDKTRTVNVEFMTTVNGALPWDFKPVVRKMTVHPGEVAEARFLAHNRSERPTVGQAVPSLAPSAASKYFNKVECFCFNRQALAGGEAQEMPLRFVVDPNLPAGIETVTLSYTFFELDGKALN